MKPNRIVGITFTIAPTSCLRCAFHPAFNRVAVNHLNIFLLCRSTNPASQIDLDTGKVALGPNEAYDSAMGSC